MLNESHSPPTSSPRGHRVRELVCGYRPLRDGDGRIVDVPPEADRRVQEWRKGLADPRLAYLSSRPDGAVLGSPTLRDLSRVCTVIYVNKRGHGGQQLEVPPVGRFRKWRKASQSGKQLGRCLGTRPPIQRIDPKTQSPGRFGRWTGTRREPSTEIERRLQAPAHSTN